MFRLQQLIPHPLKSQPLSPDTNIWGQDAVEIASHERLLVTAPSGKGKSTFVHILYGMRQDYDGNVSHEGRDIRSIDADRWADLRSRELSIVFQDLRLFPQLSAMDNILLKNNLSNFKSEEQIRQMAEHLGMTAFMGQEAGTLSYGQRQRIAIIRALCQPFKMLLLDEPFSHLDADNTARACELIANACQEQNAGFILVSLGESYSLRYSRQLLL